MCEPFDFACQANESIGNVISKAANDSLQELANQVMETYGHAVTSLGTAWVVAPTPVLTAGSGPGAVLNNPPGSGSFEQILSYVAYTGLIIAVLSLIALAVMMGVRRRRGEGEAMLGRFGIILIAAILISGASALVAAFLPSSAPAGSSTAVGFIQNSLWYYVGALTILSVMIAGVRMAWTQRAQPGKDLLQSLITLVVVSGAGLLVISLAVTAADQFSIWILNGALECDVSTVGSTCFGSNILILMQLSSTSVIGLIGIIILGVLAMLLSIVQIVLMVIRGGMLVVLAGILPASASFTNTAVGKQWFQKTVGWTIAFILYKPVAAIVYAAAFQLTGTSVFQEDGGGFWSILTGLGLMLVALLALPALMKLAAPMVSAVAGGGAAGLAVAGGAGAIGGEMATGAIQRVGANSRTAGAAGPSMAPSGAASGAAAKGAGGAAAGGGAAAAGGGAAAGAAAAAGPVGIGVAAVGAVASGAKKAGDAVKGAATSAAEDPMSGPSGA